MPANSSTIVYKLNRDDEIVFVNDAWDPFALSNSGERAIASQVIGRSIWEFVTDSDTAMFYQHAIARAREGEAQTFSFRCDAPELRRYLQMRVESVDGVVQFTSTTVSMEAREPQQLFAHGSGRSNAMIRVCSWCKRVFKNGEWLDVEDSDYQSDSLVPVVTHGICEDCRATLNKTMRGNA